MSEAVIDARQNDLPRVPSVDVASDQEDTVATVSEPIDIHHKTNDTYPIRKICEMRKNSKNAFRIGLMDSMEASVNAARPTAPHLIHP